MGDIESKVRSTMRRLLICRIRAAAANRVRPASPSNRFTSFIAGVIALVREVSYPQITPVRSSWIKMPPFGTIILLVVYLAFVLGLTFFSNNIPGAQHYEAIGLRATLLSMAQLPLIILLAGKNNLIGYVTGVSYERLNILHRWVARTLFLTATIHGFAQVYGWSRYGLVTIESETDACWPRGTETILIDTTDTL
jgi:ferric-chelate reductase